MNVAILHYSVPPVVGGVEAVIHAHAGLLHGAGYTVTLVAGAGDTQALPPGIKFTRLPEMDSRHPAVENISQALEHGTLPTGFTQLSTTLEVSLRPVLIGMDVVMVHNVFTKHFNLPLTSAIARLVEQGSLRKCIAWCHDFSWTSPHSLPSMHPGFPWDLLRTYLPGVTYVTVSRQRQLELAGLLGCPQEHIRVVYNGVDPAELYGLSTQGRQLAERLDLDTPDLILLMPLRITQAKNIELALQVVAGLKARGILPRLVVTGPPDPHDLADMQYYHHLLDLRAQLHVEQEARFVYELDGSQDGGLTISLDLVRQLYRLCDVLFMPSHREGFGMPILEAGLVGVPIFTTAIPAADEIGSTEVVRFRHDTPASEVVSMLLDWAQSSPTYKLRQRIRKNYTWQAIFQHDILPLLARENLS